MESYGFKINDKIGIYDLYLTPFNIDKEYNIEITKITNYITNKYQKINRFFSYEEYTFKSLLYINYKKFKNKFPSDYNFMLETYCFPEEKTKIEEKFNSYQFRNKIDDIWMIKPSFGGGGFNISILYNYSNIELKQYIITK